MADFIVDFRSSGERQIKRAAQRLRFFPDLSVFEFDRGSFGLALVSPDDPANWGPFVSGDGHLLVALAGRLALEEADWREADALPGEGGAACRLVAARYRERGAGALGAFGGNFVLIVHDSRQSKIILATDRWGAFPAFRAGPEGKPILWGSHPDVLADAMGEGRNWDTVSVAEFLMSGRVSPPFTYHKGIRALPWGSFSTVDLSGGKHEESAARYARYEFQGSPDASETELAEELAEGFRRSVRRRALPRLGRTAVALSGGLDSRSILCAASDRNSIVSFCSHDEINYEYRIAERIAAAAGVQLIPFRRPFDFYGNSADAGAGISGGMGCIGCNHFLGFRKELLDLGVKNLLTGCYCDYVFKGLVMNKVSRGFLKQEEFGGFSHECYEPHLRFDTPAGRQALERLDSQFPADLRHYRTEEDRWVVEQKRLFPLCYETDNVQRVVPQRVLGWSPPIADNEIFSAYLKIPCRYKLNRSVFLKVTRILCGKAISDIPDANTGAPVGAPPWRAFAGGKWLQVQRKLLKLKKSIATNQSWPDWDKYIRGSDVIKGLWQRPNAAGWELIREITGAGGEVSNLGSYTNSNMTLFHHVFSMKLWLDSRLL